MKKRMVGVLVMLGGIAAFGQGSGGGNSLLEPAMTFDEAVAAAKKGEARGYYQLAIKFSAGEIVREDAEKMGVPNTIPASEGLDAL